MDGNVIDEILNGDDGEQPIVTAGDTDGTTLAYVRRSSDGLPHGLVAVWDLTRDRNAVMAADASDLLFVDEMTPDDVMEHFQASHQPSQSGLTNCRFKWESRESRGYTPKPKAHPSSVELLGFEYYAGKSAEEACQLAQQCPAGYVMYIPEGSSYYHSQQWAPNRHWNYKTRKYEYDPDPLEEFGCYRRVVERYVCGEKKSVREVVYNPKIVERRIRNRKRRETEAAKRFPKSGWLHVSEFDEVTQDLLKLVPSTRLLVDVDASNDRRWACMHAFVQALHIVWLIFDKKAHRQSKAFRDLLRKWRTGTRAEETRKAWHEVDRSLHVFRWLDAEAKAVKHVRKRKLPDKASFPV